MYDDKRYERIQKRLFRRAKISKQDTEPVIKEKLLKFAESKRENYNLIVVLPKNLISNAKFMLDLYRVNPDLIDVLEPNKVESPLANNVNFMVEYVKLAYKVNTERHKKHYIVLKPRNELLWALQNCSNLLLNPEFIQKLAKTFPEVNVFDVAEAKIVRVDGREEEIQMFNEMLNQLPKEFVEEQVSKFGAKVLLTLPHGYEGFDKLIALGVKKDGFKSLRLFPIDKITKNKNLIVEAYKVDGREALKDYVNNGLSPFRSVRLKFNNIYADAEYENYFDAGIDKIQTEILRDKEISDLLNGKEVDKTEVKKPIYDFAQSTEIQNVQIRNK